MIIDALILLLSLIILVKGSGFFVKSAASIAKRMGVSEFVIGLTLIAIGTSLPELVSAIFASIKHESGLVMGNIVGANIANIGLIIGIAAVITALKTRKHMLERDGYFMIFTALLLFVFVIDSKISRIEGLFFLLLFIAYNIFLFETKPEFKQKYHFAEFIKYFYKFKYMITIKDKIISNFNHNKIHSLEIKKIRELFRAALFKDVLMIVFSGYIIIMSANFLIEEAVFFAKILKVPITLIGILMSLGTTMPEMSVAVTAARKGYGNIVIGNSIGSCLSNSLLILGIAALIFPLSVINATKYYTIPFFIFLSILFLIFVKSEWKIERKEGIIFLILYVLFLGLVFIITNI